MFLPSGFQGHSRRALSWEIALPGKAARLAPSPDLEEAVYGALGESNHK